MAQPTTSTPHENPQQARTPGVGATPGSVTGMGSAPHGVFGAGVPQKPDTPPAPPVLFEDIDPVYLMRLYPDSKDGRGDAEKAGKAAFDMSTKLHASQQDPIGVQEPQPEGAPKQPEPPKH